MSNEPVVIRTYGSEMEANLAMSTLEDVGLVSCILNPVNRISYYNLPDALYTASARRQARGCGRRLRGTGVD